MSTTEKDRSPNVSLLDLQVLDVPRERRDGGLEQGGGSTLSVAICG